MTKRGVEHPGVGVGAVVIKDDHLLMVRRDGAHGAGTLSVPGGWVEWGEEPRATAEREVLEETGVVVVADSHGGWTSVVDEGIHAFTLWIMCRYMSGPAIVTEPDKCPEVKWVPMEEVEKLPLFAPLAKAWPVYDVRFWPYERLWCSECGIVHSNDAKTVSFISTRGTHEDFRKHEAEMIKEYWRDHGDIP